MADQLYRVIINHHHNCMAAPIEEECTGAEPIEALKTILGNFMGYADWAEFVKYDKDSAKEFLECCKDAQPSAEHEGGIVYPCDQICDCKCQPITVIPSTVTLASQSIKDKTIGIHIPTNSGYVRIEVEFDDHGTPRAQFYMDGDMEYVLNNTEGCTSPWCEGNSHLGNVEVVVVDGGQSAFDEKHQLKEGKVNA